MMSARGTTVALASVLACVAVIACVFASSVHATRASGLGNLGDLFGEMHEYFTWKTGEDMLDIAGRTRLD